MVLPDFSQVSLAIGLLVGVFLLVKLVLKIAGFALKLALLAGIAVGVYLLWDQYLR